MTNFEKFAAEQGRHDLATALEDFGEAATCWPEYDAWHKAELKRAKQAKSAAEK